MMPLIRERTGNSESAANSYASLAIACFDGGWVFVKTPATPGEDDGDEVLRYFRTTFQYRDSVPWWHHPNYWPIKLPKAAPSHIP